MNITLICVGTIKEKYFVDAINEYLKRIKVLAQFKIIEVKEINHLEITKNLNLEAKSILNYIKDNDYVISLCLDGVSMDSVELSGFLSKHFTYNDSNLIFIIGSSHGLSDEVIKRSNYKLSLSKMTFPHQLARVIFVEQIYRSLAIINNLKYHK